MIYHTLSEGQAKEFARTRKTLWACACTWDPNTKRWKYHCEPVKGHLFFQSFGEEIRFFPEGKNGRRVSRTASADYRIREYADTKEEAETLYRNLERKAREQYGLPEPRKVYNRKTGTFVELPLDVAAFYRDMEAVCRKHGYQFSVDMDTLIVEPYTGNSLTDLEEAELYL